MKSPSGASFLAHFLVLVALMLAPVSAEAMDPTWAQPGKVLRVSMDGEEAGFDPQAANDSYSATVMTAINRKWADLLKMARAGQLQVWMVGTFPVSADAVMLTLYGPNAGSNNLARFRNAEFDALYRKARATANAEERGRAYQRMAQIVGIRNPWGLRIYAIRSALVRPWVQGFQRNPHFFQVWRFCDIDAGLQKTGKPKPAAQ